MAERIGKKLKIKKIIRTALIIVLVVAVVGFGVFWNRNLNKNSLLEKYETQQKQEVYLLGTLHENHFNKWINYSMEDVLSVLANTQPDVVFIEAREEYFKKYGVMDGPVDMAVVYGYCIDHNIPVQMIDWWVVDNNYHSNTTSDQRDDMMFKNIVDKLESTKADAKILVVCGAGHFYEQENRFLKNGFEKREIDNKAAYFDSKDTGFKYPASTAKVWGQRAYFYAYTYPKIVGEDETLNASVKAEFTEGNHDAFYNQQLKYCELFSNNVLYQ